ncbi:MAG TPA: tetratricopeptide repeat protein [Thermoanaerobaculia bacterium]|nr:tetratricopeptide repeat protein [Thermoanaerobaculia bacterium]
MLQAQESPVPAPAPQAQTATPAAAPSANDEEFTKAAFFGHRFAELGEYASAYEQFEKANAIKPDDPAVLYDMAVVLARAGRYSDAQVKVDRYLQLFPEGAERANVSKLQLELEFQRELQKKRQADQEYADLFNRAKFVYARGELTEALRLFKLAEQQRPNDAANVYNQAVILEKQADYVGAIERFRRYSELESDADRKARIDERVFGLQHEVDDMSTKIVCSFCGHKLPAGATWCERCWHGPYLVNSPVWNTRSCASGASATRATYFSDARFNRNDILPCLFNGPSLREALRYSPARQREIRNARRAEGWTYDGEALTGFTDKAGNQIKYEQGAEYLERVTSTSGGEVLTYAAHASAPGVWLLDREELIVDGQRYTNKYNFDANGRIAQQLVEYQNNAACNHLISMNADYVYGGDQLMNVNLSGGYKGFVGEGAPDTSWNAMVMFAYDEQKRLAKEELTVTKFDKMYAQKAQGALRDDINKLYVGGMRVKKPIETVQRVGDLCGTQGNAFLSNPIDLRPFYALSPNLALALQNGVTKAVVKFTYP